MLFTVRPIKREDCNMLYQIFLKDGFDIPERQFLAYFSEQQRGERKVFLAQYEGEILGYTTLIARPKIGPFTDICIPQISDLNILSRYRNCKIASDLILICENEAVKISDRISVCVPLSSDFGQAQSMFSKRNYLLDGSGAWHCDKPINTCENIDNSKNLSLYLIKDLKVMRDPKYKT